MPNSSLPLPFRLTSKMRLSTLRYASPKSFAIFSTSLPNSMMGGLSCGGTCTLRTVGIATIVPMLAITAC